MADTRLPGLVGRVRAWLAGLRHHGQPTLFLAGVLLFVGCAGATVAAAGTAELPRHLLTDAGSPVALEAEAAVVGLVLEAGQVPPGLEAGEQVVVFDTGPHRKQPLVDAATVTAVSGRGGAVHIGLEVPANTAADVAAAGAHRQVAVAKLPMA